MIKNMIHIIRNNAFGDVLWVEPILRYFIENNKRVNIITWKPELSDNYPDKRLFVNYPLPKWQKSILKRIHFPGLPRVINLNGAYESNPKEHILKAYMKSSGIPDTVPLSLPRIYLNEQKKIAPYRESYAVLHIEPHPLITEMFMALIGIVLQLFYRIGLGAESYCIVFK
jgi:hypothetical protein